MADPEYVLTYVINGVLLESQSDVAGLMKWERGCPPRLCMIGGRRVAGDANHPHAEGLKLCRESLIRGPTQVV